jgi:hypothetical protein
MNLKYIINKDRPVKNNALILNNSSAFNIYNVNSSVTKKNLNTLALTPNNDIKIITIRNDTTPLRNNGYFYFSDRFKKPPTITRYKFCAPKIATIYSTNGNLQWFSAYVKKPASFKSVNTNIVKGRSLFISDSNGNCDCDYTDFSGKYFFNICENPSLISTNNLNTKLANMFYDKDNQYFDIKIYSKYNKSYVWIRFRITLKYRWDDGRWVFNPKFVIDKIMSETEFASIVDCCDYEDFSLYNKIK